VENAIKCLSLFPFTDRVVSHVQQIYEAILRTCVYPDHRKVRTLAFLYAVDEEEGSSRHGCTSPTTRSYLWIYCIGRKMHTGPDSQPLPRTIFP